ncbi:MAG: hypothetical protein OHK93_008116 [Ramalina farinacea]|uniref:Glycosyltransferase family 69 protein n=1 Tax=Ramalina farinacea TaxID=258253 RepID=A0AA43QR44_9LECA|nr:hypothetical protein [Ramalina farinacea]
MPALYQFDDDYELVNRQSLDTGDDFDLDEADFQSHGRTASLYSPSPSLGARVFGVLVRYLPWPFRRKGYRKLQHQVPKTAGRPSRRTQRACFWMNALLCAISVLVVLTAILNPSYSRPPKHYRELREMISASGEPGRGNPENQRIFVAASLYDLGGHLLGGAWGERVLELLEILGNQNVFLSIYENEGSLDAMTAKVRYEKKVQCKHSIIYDTTFSLAAVPHVTMPDGSRRVKRTAFLAEARNRALEALEDQPAVRYDKILYLNDVLFDPIEAVQLLFATNLDGNGHPSYQAACAVDFINPFKYYDTFATRDEEGYSMGVPFFPWFAGRGKGLSRRDVLQGKDAVRVKSCWGGMVAFDAEPFQGSEPLRFRASKDLFWDASECCLIHADILSKNTTKNQSGIYMNPFVRVAYDQKTLSWLRFTRRLERLYTIPHSIVNRMVGLPWSNARRAEEAGQMVTEQVWVSDDTLDGGGSFQMQEREAGGDGYCGRRGLQLIKQTPRSGEKNWEQMPLPPG